MIHDSEHSWIEMTTYIELQKQIESLQKEAEALKDRERSGVIERMREAIDVYDITPSELGFGANKRAAQKGSKKSGGRNAGASKRNRTAAYSDKEGNTWGGRGPRPKWLKDALAAGAKLEDFAR